MCHVRTKIAAKQSSSFVTYLATIIINLFFLNSLLFLGPIGSIFRIVILTFTLLFGVLRLITQLLLVLFYTFPCLFQTWWILLNQRSCQCPYSWTFRHFWENFLFLLGNVLNLFLFLNPWLSSLQDKLSHKVSEDCGRQPQTKVIIKIF